MRKISTERGDKNGFAALMTAIIISLLLLSITLTLGMTGFFSRFNVLDSESKERSSALAEACGDVTILKIVNGEAIPSEINIDGNICKIVAVNENAPFSGQTTITTKATVNKAVTNLKIIIDDEYRIVSWEEAASP